LAPFEKEYFRKDGSRVPVLTGVATLEEGANQGVAFVLDISERKRAERALRDSEELKRRIIESSRDCIKVLDLDGNLLFMSSGGQQLLEIDNIEPYLNTCWINFWQPEDRPKISETIAAARAGGVGKFQAFCPSAKGASRWWDVITTPICNADGQPVQLLSVSRDITESKRAEAEARESERGYREMEMALAHANRVATMVQLSASIAHEINQPIAAVIANANAGLRWLGARPPDLNEARQALGRIVRDGTRAGEVIDRIRSLVKKTPPRRDRLDINEAMREVIPLIQAELQRKRVRLQARLADGLPHVSGDRVQLQQVITNLIINAIEAMSGISDGPRELTIVSGAGASDDLFVEVHDTGTGLDPEQLDRLFQSFYTTKPDGIGMGLAISRSIAEAHGGCLSAAPNTPRGAVFRLALPVDETLSGNPERSRPSAAT
jgi:PAS domain S-box-containing protein